MTNTRPTPRLHAGCLAPFAAAILLVAGCAEIKPMEYTEIHEIQPGPGLFSGEDGAFVLYAD